MILLLLLILLLVGINALYVSAEFSAVSVKKSTIQQMAASVNRTAIAFLPIVEEGKNLDRYIATCQIGITLSSIVLGAFGQVALTSRLTPWSQALTGMPNEAAFGATAFGVLILLTVFQMIFGELIPKSISLQFPTRTALYTHAAMNWSMVLFSGFIAILNGSGNFLLGIFGVKASAHRHIHSPDEIELLIAESRDGGALEVDEHIRLQKALALSSRKADEIMISRTRIVAIDLASPPTKVKEIVMNSPYTRFPVYNGTVENVVGLLHTKDFASHYIQGGDMPLLKNMLRPVPSIPSTVTADRVLTLLKKRKAHQAVIIDEYGGLAGIVTLEDILSEMMGSIGDEYKRPTSLAEQLPDGRVRLSGDLRLDEAERWIGILWQSEAYTVSGRVTEALGDFPTPGAKTTIDGVEVEVEKVERKAIVTILARPRADKSEKEDD